MSKQKLFFKFDNTVPSELSLADIVAGRAGTAVLGKQGIFLWTPNSGLPKDGIKDVVCDMRFAPLSTAVYEKFVEDTKGLYLPAYFVIFCGSSPERIEYAHKHFDYVVTPQPHIQNTPADFRNGILSYVEPKLAQWTAPKITYSHRKNRP